MISASFQQLLYAFSQAHRCNIAIYFINKLLSLSILFFLYYHLTPNTFATWANVTSIVYIFLLWSDFGFRKSIPRFAPLFLQCGTIHYFMRFLIIIHVCMLICTLPVFIYSINRIIVFSLPDMKLWVLGTATAAYISEGIVFLLRLVYQSYFLHKPITLLTSLISLAETGITIMVIYYVYTSPLLIPLLLCIKSIASIITSSAYIILIPLPPTEQKNVNTQIKHEFIKHSFIMWLYTALKSLSERNVLLPFITYTLNAEYAGIYKLANESALFFYRLVLKTIGTTDTSLLSFIEEQQDQQHLMEKAFEKLSTKVMALCVPLVGIILGFYIGGETFVHNQYVFQLFLIMTVTYLAELVLLPYERLLEVKKNYWYLASAYIPYIITLIVLYTTSCISLIGLKGIIILIQIVRLVSIGIVTYYAHIYIARKINVRSMCRQFMTIIVIASTVALGSYMLKSYMSIPKWIGAVLKNV
jgi:hypothetical protein